MNTKKYKKGRITNLVFEGGGVLGIAYAGVIKALEEANLLKNIREVAGTSVGAIAAAAVACGATSEFADIYIKPFDPNTLLDGSRYKIKIFYDVNKDLGWCRGQVFENWIEEMLDELINIFKKSSSAAEIKLKNRVNNCGRNITFDDILCLFGRKLYITGTSLSEKTLKYFSPETTPNMPVKTAIRISASIPFIFAPVRYEGELYIDGGWLSNYPIQVFDIENGCQTADETLGFMLINKIEREDVGSAALTPKMEGAELKFSDEKNKNKTKKDDKIDNIFSFAAALVETLFKGGQDVFLEKDDLERTVMIETGEKISSLNFNIDNSSRDELYNKGYIYTKKYLDKNIL
jgi:NTE family protein